MKKVFVTLILAIMVLSISGCARRIADLTYVSTKNVSEQDLSASATDGERVTGEDKSHIIIFIPTGTPNAEEALDRAIESKPGGVELPRFSGQVPI